MRIHENDREGLERLCRYAVRPPFALHRLSQGPDRQPATKPQAPDEAPDSGPEYDGTDPTYDD